MKGLFWVKQLQSSALACRFCTHLLKTFFALPAVGLSSLQALLLCTSGVAFQLTLFTRNSFALVFLLLLMVNLALTAFGFFMSSLLRRAAG